MKPILSRSILMFLLSASAGSTSDLPVSVPNDPALEVRMMDLVLNGDKLADSKIAKENPKEFAHAKDLAEQVRTKLLEDTKDDTSFVDRLNQVRNRYALNMTGEQMLAVSTDGDREYRLKMLQAATHHKVSDEELAEMDEELFWAAIDEGEKERGREIAIDEESGALIEIDPEKREATVNIYDSGKKSGTMLDFVVPTLWAPEQSESQRPKAEDFQSDDLFLPLLTEDDESSSQAAETTGNDAQQEEASRPLSVPEPVEDDDFEPILLTEEDFEPLFASLNGFWNVDGELWHIKTSGPLDGDIKDSKERLQKRLDNINQDLKALADNPKKVYVWENRSTGDITYQKRFKRLDTDLWDYKSEQVDPEQAEKIEALEAEKKALSAKLGETPDDLSQDPSGFQTLAATGKAVQVRVVKAKQCPYEMDNAYFDGRNFSTEYIHKNICSMNPSLNRNIAQKLITENRPRNTQTIFRVTMDPRTEQLRLRGREWSRTVHHDTGGTKINSITGLENLRAKNGDKPLGDDDSYLKERAFGAADNEVL